MCKWKRIERFLVAYECSRGGSIRRVDFAEHGTLRRKVRKKKFSSIGKNGIKSMTEKRIKINKSE